MEVFLKCENFQRTGSFKVRGAYVRVARLSTIEQAAGLVAASAGNHAQGVAFAAQTFGLKATVFMPRGASTPKVSATRALGAKVIFAGDDVASCLVAAEKRAAQDGSTLVHPFDHPDVVAGQGSVGLEVMEAVPDVGTILVPIGGGGLAAGISVLRELRPDIRVVGVQAANAPSYVRARAADHPVTCAIGPTSADGLAVTRTGDVPFAVLARYLSDVVTVTEQQIGEAQLQLLERSKILVEPAGAAAAAAALAHPSAMSGTVVCIISGGNVSASKLAALITSPRLQAWDAPTQSGLS